MLERRLSLPEPGVGERERDKCPGPRTIPAAAPHREPEVRAATAREGSDRGDRCLVDLLAA